MSDVLLGTIIGGVIASIIPTVTVIVEYKKWKKAQKLDNLRKKRDNLEKTYKKTIEGLKKGIINDYFTIEMIADFEILFPKDVLNSFQEYMKEDKKNKYQKAIKYQNIIKSMKRSISQIDKDIDSILS
jgi:gas vesicle protein